jgi:tetraacyldisaccharide 4'-kinase
VTAALLATARPRAWLAPLGAVFGGAGALRAALYRRGILTQARLAAPVISIGNLAVGGRGKTPLVQRTAELVRDAGRHVAVLSRGYGGSFQGETLIVSDGTHVLADAEQAGDEPVMLGRVLPGVIVAVGRDRAIVGKTLEATLRPDVHLLDDGFQHLGLYRGLDIVCVDAEDLRDRPLPAGLLREKPAALARADIVMVSGEHEDEAGAARASLAQRLGAERVFRVRRAPAGFTDLGGSEAPAPVRVFLLTGIARPERVTADLERQGIVVAGKATFPDHHRFRDQDIAAALRDAATAGVDAIVTTLKDVPRLPASVGSTIPLRVFRVRTEIEDEARFRERVLAAAGVGGGAQASAGVASA